MGIVERLKIGYAAFKGEAGVQLPDGGRSSVETFGGMLSAFLAPFATISPVIDFEMLKTLKHLWLYNPDVSQYVANIVNLGNPGHQLSVDAKTDATIGAAIDRMNDASQRVYPNACGVDGLIEQYLTSIAWSGAISSEDVVNLAAGRVEKVVLVPVEQIRFKYNKATDNYDPYQRANTLFTGNALGLNPLNPETYKYFALSTVENSPYAKPPATAAVEAIMQSQKPIMDNIQFMAQKVGLMGMVAVSVVPPSKKPGESEGEYQLRATSYIQAVKKALSGTFNRGLIVTARDQKVEHTSVTTGASGVYDINRISEEQVFSGLAAIPGFHGRTDSTTETFADVVYYLLTAQVSNMQRPVKRRMEQTYRLDLRLGGIDVSGVSLTFNKAHSRNALSEAQTNQTTVSTVIEKVKSGLLSPDEGAQELGYDNWFDPALLSAGLALAVPTANLSRLKAGIRTINLSFDKNSQRYRYQPERLEIWSGQAEAHADNVVPIKKNGLLRINEA